MKLISWNVNGLRACMTKGFADFMTASDADIFCVQETKMQREQATFDFPNYFEYWNSPNYFEYWNSAEKKGYSGTAVFTKKEPLNVTYGLGIDEHDHEGRVITCEFPEFNLVNVYTPNSQDGLTRLAYRQVWEDAFRNYLLELDAKKPVLVCGDLNVAHNNIDLKNWKTGAMPALPMKSGASSRNCWLPASPIRSAICIRIKKAFTPGGPTGSRPEKRTPVGVLTTGWCPTAGRIRLKTA